MREHHANLVLRAGFFVLCPLHQERYEAWCYLCGRVTARRYGWNARPIPWYIEPESGERMRRFVLRELASLRN